MSDSISRVLDQLAPNRRTLDRLVSTGGSLMLVIYWHSNGNTGEEFAPDLLHQLADLNITLGIDVYSNGNSSSDG